MHARCHAASHLVMNSLHILCFYLDVKFLFQSTLYHIPYTTLLQKISSSRKIGSNIPRRVDLDSAFMLLPLKLLIFLNMQTCD